ncbi:50S ribosomal protein L29 [Sulfurisphaera ohwakuensis]|uniref:Large ribosomal subunit protein uL29 n=1 Tax=Sulfurisphaera ohwakuensis TaxID=69656 RepID=A0A650CEA1_SULOH|nr:50S ribosomal protein L29 [Sulfurisphaera ohwakuensis]MBB5252998.1 large subunit ribosomal protein L29 [Sulfurisphaera ohwakuensis]QGR16076.1 50S ribosomal protein L29 [Sulfurisphaera ohwakuensis]
MKSKEILGYDIKEINNQTVEQLLEKKKELQGKLNDLQQELLKRKVEARMGTLKNTASIRNLRKDIARILTLLSIINKEIENKKKESKK